MLVVYLESVDESKEMSRASLSSKCLIDFIETKLFQLAGSGHGSRAGMSVETGCVTCLNFVYDRWASRPRVL